MVETTVIWAGVVVFLGLLIKGEFVAKRRSIEARYDGELLVLGARLDVLVGDVESLKSGSHITNDRLVKVERQVNDAQVAKTLGRGR